MSHELPPINGDFSGKHIVSTLQFEPGDVEQVFTEADAMEEMVSEQGRDELLEDVVVANLFYEASTRTFLSFETAAKRLGAATISAQGVEYSSISKDENLQDTIRTVERYADLIVMRHEAEGAAVEAASVADIPIINAGDGIGEHPTQALLDLYTIRTEGESLDGISVTMVGDLKHGRTVHSLAKLLSLYDVRLQYVSPEELTMPVDIISEIGLTTRQYETTDLEEVLPETDVLYVTRIQKERFEIESEYLKHKGAYTINAKTLRAMDEDAIIMHPFPRNTEIDPEVDADDRAAYFDQIENGMYVRMALLALVNGRSIER